MPLRDFRSVEYYRMKKDNSWDTQTILIPFEIPYEQSIDYIWDELNGLKMIDDIQSISISNFPESFVTVTE
jgi:hypothetical protein